MVMASSVLPWKACSKTTTPWRLVKEREILTAFSTASAPELVNIVRCSPPPGTSALSFSASATYASFIVTCMQVCVKRSSCSRTASWTAGEEFPVFRTARPAPRSIRLLPSTSRRMAPDAAPTNTGVVKKMPCGTAAFRRSSRARDLGPGISVMSRRSWGISISPPVRGLVSSLPARGRAVRVRAGKRADGRLYAWATATVPGSGPVGPLRSLSVCTNRTIRSHAPHRG